QVLVTGANGYIATWTIHALLEAGFAVLGAVRSEDKCTPLRELFASYGDKFEVVVVPDMSKGGAFDGLVQDVDAIEHIATPTNIQLAPGLEFIAQTVEATLSILRSTLMHGKRIQRVVLTSSIAAIRQVEEGPKTLTELDWNEQALIQIAEMGDSAPWLVKYRTSKVLGERAAWKFVEDHKASQRDIVVALHPPFVAGPPLHDTPTPDALRTTARVFYTNLTQPGTPQTIGGNEGFWIDVRDVARAHLLCLLTEAAGGERLIISAGSFVWQDWFDAVAAATNSSPKYNKGSPGTGKDVVHSVQLDTSKAARILGMTEYRSMAETARDITADWEARGW
ncbi:D-lactaldehyde dehydrogenase, partial [Mycena metata]